MTEVQWLTSADALALLDHLFPQRGHDSGPAQPRPLRLYYAALARQVWGRLPAAGRALTEFAERAADRAAPLVARDAVREIAERLADPDAGGPAAEPGVEAALAAAGVPVPPGRPWHGPRADWDRLARLLYQPHARYVPIHGWVAAADHRADLVRDVFGNPFRPPVGLAPGWRTPTVVGLARRMYDAREFGPMPVLADALEDAGCDRPDVLGHCRAADPHCRGCWVVDLVLGLT